MILQFVLYESGTGALTVKYLLRVFEGKRSEENFDLRERKAEHIVAMMTL
jgi:hypothetical protein